MIAASINPRLLNDYWMVTLPSTVCASLLPIMHAGTRVEDVERGLFREEAADVVHGLVLKPSSQGLIVEPSG